MKNFFRAILCISFLIGSYAAFAKPVIYVNQIAFDSNAPKTAVIELDSKAAGKLSFNLIDANGKIVFIGFAAAPQIITEWFPGKVFYKVDFSTYNKTGKYKLQVKAGSTVFTSYQFEIGEN
ncbi:cellulase N-terminal Ig-like domain-containing protein, partial [Mucilaginibacter sp. 5B2]|nr:cellulase N-terminal Ig-like domain-containing protein [Mucilaginibacter sp. 5B2]